MCFELNNVLFDVFDLPLDIHNDTFPFSLASVLAIFISIVDKVDVSSPPYLLTFIISGM